MANEIIVALNAQYDNVYAILYDGTNNRDAWDHNIGAFQQLLGSGPGASNWNNYAVVLSPLPFSNDEITYIGSIPANVPRRILNVVVKRQLGANPADTDPNLAAGVLAWDGSAVVFPATYTQVANLQTSVTGVQTSVTGVQSTADLIQAAVNQIKALVSASPVLPSSDDCFESIPYSTLVELATFPKQSQVDGQMVTERSADDLIRLDKHIAARKSACTNRGNGWNSIGVSRAISPDGSGRN